MGAQFLGVLVLGAAAVDRDGLETHRPGELHPEVAQPADAEDRDPVTGQRLGVTQRVVAVVPAQPIGAASASVSPSGIRASALDGTVTDSAYPPGYCQLGTLPFRQWMNCPFRH